MIKPLILFLSLLLIYQSPLLASELFIKKSPKKNVSKKDKLKGRTARKMDYIIPKRKFHLHQKHIVFFIPPTTHERRLRTLITL